MLRDLCKVKANVGGVRLGGEWTKPTSQFKTRHEGFVVCIATPAAKQHTDTFDISRTNVGGV